jgi:hypothetical protein
MQRRTLLRVGLGAGALLAVAGWGVSMWTPGLQGRRLSPPARAVVVAVANAVLDGLLPLAPQLRAAALQAQAERFEQSVAGLAPATRQELSQLLAMLCTPPGRLALCGVSVPWERATVAEVQAALHTLRSSGSQTRQQVYHALRDLNNAAWFADSSHWGQMGYPGPLVIGGQP